MVAAFLEDVKYVGLMSDGGLVVNGGTLHIIFLDKFIGPYIDLLEGQNYFNEQIFFLFGDSEAYPIKRRQNTIFEADFRSVVRRYFFLVKRMLGARKIILHGLIDSRPLVLLFLMPFLLRKCYWIIWGIDLYIRKIGKRTLKWRVKEVLRRVVIGRVGAIVTGTKGDYDLAVRWYGARGRYIECFNYPSNIYKEYVVPPRRDDGIRILVGNSADPSNNHMDILDALSKYRGENIKIIVPLSYGNPKHREAVCDYGRQLFGEKFVPLLQYMELDDYIGLLAGIDIAVYAHRRQQAFGNKITLLGMGKKVFMRPESTLWQVFSSRDIKVFDVSELDILPLDKAIAADNIVKVRKYFSRQGLLDSISAWMA